MLWIIWRQHNDWVFDPSSMAFGKDIPSGTTKNGGPFPHQNDIKLTLIAIKC